MELSSGKGGGKTGPPKLQKSSTLKEYAGKHFLCPLCNDIMTDPVTLVCSGVSYDFQCLQDYYQKGNRTCPKTGAQITDDFVIPNAALRDMIAEFVAKDPENSGVHLKPRSGAQPLRLGDGFGAPVLHSSSSGYPAMGAGDVFTQAQALLPMLKSGKDADRRSAAASVARLAADRIENMDEGSVSRICEAGVVPSLVDMLKVKDKESRVQAASALARISAARCVLPDGTSGPAFIGGCGAVMPLLQVLRDRVTEGIEPATCALANLSRDDANQQVIAQSSGVPICLDLLVDGQPMEREAAETILSELAHSPKIAYQASNRVLGRHAYPATGAFWCSPRPAAPVTSDRPRAPEQDEEASQRGIAVPSRGSGPADVSSPCRQGCDAPTRGGPGPDGPPAAAGRGGRCLPPGPFCGHPAAQYPGGAVWCWDAAVPGAAAHDAGCGELHLRRQSSPHGWHDAAAHGWHDAASDAVWDSHGRALIAVVRTPLRTAATPGPIRGWRRTSDPLASIFKQIALKNEFPGESLLRRSSGLGGYYRVDCASRRRRSKSEPGQGDLMHAGGLLQPLISAPAAPSRLPPPPPGAWPARPPGYPLRPGSGRCS